ncbi:hypothetical protein [Streptomyces sp. NBC_01361]|uniref:hypothetical protein n=1 Tax=Streptomyces sp. NBC_01361 TaxID=2903838 RepID=UPI002E37E306|nr:hypothetical protein [Streptomyces sp. NBC_01361]
MSTPTEAPAAEGADAVVVGRCYTHARRHPLVIGRFPGGGRLWGGPYTIPQAVVIAATFVVLMMFRPLWAHFGVLGNVVIAFALPYALGFLVRKVNVDGRNPLAVAGSVFGLMGAPSTGRMGGRPVKTPGRRRPLHGLCTVTLRDPAGQQPAEAPAFLPGPGAREQTSPQPAGVSPSGAAQPQVLSGAAALLAARRSSRDPAH